LSPFVENIVPNQSFAGPEYFNGRFVLVQFSAVRSKTDENFEPFFLYILLPRNAIFEIYLPIIRFERA